MKNLLALAVVAAIAPDLAAQGPKPDGPVVVSPGGRSDGPKPITPAQGTPPSTQGTSGQGTSGQGTSGQGTSGQGTSGQGTGTSGQGPSGQADKPAPGAKPAPTQDTVVIAPARQDPLPAGADPADLRAMRGAQQMLEAEQKLKDMIKSGKIKNVDQILTFEEISSWPYEDGLKGMPAPVKALDAKKVLMTGFMLPIDEVENIKEFLLVQSLWSCCYGQPPDINGIVRVVMKGDKRIDYQFEPIQVTGEFKVVATIEDGYCVDIFQLLADEVVVIQ